MIGNNKLGGRWQVAVVGKVLGTMTTPTAFHVTLHDESGMCEVRVVHQTSRDRTMRKAETNAVR